MTRVSWCELAAAVKPALFGCASAGMVGAYSPGMKTANNSKATEMETLTAKYAARARKLSTSDLAYVCRDLADTIAAMCEMDVVMQAKLGATKLLAELGAMNAEMARR
jgi:1-deoxy-D-xylulose 5-phosphate reductoisomerase